MSYSPSSGTTDYSAETDVLKILLLLVVSTIVASFIGISLWGVPGAEVRSLEPAVAEYVDKHQCSVVSVSGPSPGYRCNYPEPNQYLSTHDIRSIVKASLASVPNASKLPASNSVGSAHRPARSSSTQEHAWRVKYIEQNGCVVADTADGNATRFRCDRPRPGTYLSAEELTTVARVNQ